MLSCGTGALSYQGKPCWLHGSWEHGRLAQTQCYWKLSHSPWMQSTVGCCTHVLFLGVGWWHGDGQSLRSLIWSQPVLKAGGNLEFAVSIARGCVIPLCKWWGANWLACSSLCLMCCPSYAAKQSLCSAMLLEFDAVEDIWTVEWEGWLQLPHHLVENHL